MNHDEEYAKHAPDHDQAPWHLMRALILLAHGAEFGLREHADDNQTGGKTEAYDPVE